MKNKLIALIMTMVGGACVLAILEMHSSGIVGQGVLAFALLICMAIVSFVGGVYFDIQSMHDNFKDKSIGKFLLFFHPWV